MRGKQRNANEVIGIEFTTNEDYQVIITDYINAHKVQVMFLDEHKHKMWTQWDSLKNGSLKNPFHKSVYEVGYLGTDKNGEIPNTTENGKLTREYRLWSNMLRRCYSEEYHEKYPTYKYCEVCERWKCYVYFLEDLPKIKNYEYWRDNPQQRIALNKDIYYSDLGIITDCKEYSLLTTRFISNKENAEDMIERHISQMAKRIRCIETQVIYDSVQQASRETGLNDGNIIKCCKGKLKTCGKLHWEYVD